MSLRTWYDVHYYDVKDVVERAVKTAIQTAAAAGVLAAALGGDWQTTRTVALSAVAAGISVIWNAVLSWANAA